MDAELSIEIHFSCLIGESFKYMLLHFLSFSVTEDISDKTFQNIWL